MKRARRYGSPPAALCALALACIALVLGGCGGGSPSSAGVAHLATKSSSTADGGAAPGPGSNSQGATLRAFASCMRSNGLPNFPEPSGGGFRFHRGGGIDPFSPAFKAAQAKCKQFQPEGPGSGPPPSAQTLARYLTVAQCMRRHGVPEFPDPKASIPPNLHPPTGARHFVISDIEGVILVMGSIDTQSPVFTRAAAACAFPLHNH